MRHILARPASSDPINMPSLGELCLQHGIHMKGRLARFLKSRPHLFSLGDDGRQHVHLVPGAAQALGLPPAAPAAHRPPSLGLPTLPEDLLLDAATGEDVPPGFAQRPPSSALLPRSARRDLDYSKWDSLTKAIYHFVQGRGSATFADIDAHCKQHWVESVQACGVPLAMWSSSVFLRKRRTIFRTTGPNVTIAAGPTSGPTGPSFSQSPAQPPAAALPAALIQPSQHSPPTVTQEAFPPLPGSAAERPSTGPAPGGAALGAQPLSEERAALEALRDDVKDSLSSLRALSELQKENAGLRAACVTLGRELLSLKDDFTALRRQLATSLGPEFAPTLSAVTSHFSAPANGAPPNGGAPAAGHAPASAAGAAASDASFLPSLSAPSSSTQILLVGGHDGVSWLDSVDCFSPADGTWTSLPAMDRPRSFCVAVADADAVYVAGGGNGVEWYGSVLRMDRHVGGTWKELAQLQVPRGSMAAAFACGHLYVYGGGKPGEQYNAVEW